MSKLEKSINLLLVTFVFFLPWQTRWIIRWGELGEGYSEFLRVSLYGSALLLLAALVLAALRIKFKEKDPAAALSVLNPIWLIIGFWELMVFVSIFRAEDWVLAIYRYLLFLAGVGVFFLVQRPWVKRLWLEMSLVAAGLVQALFSIVQFAAQTGIKSKWLGLAFHDPGLAGTAVVLDLSGNRYLRSYGAFDHPNILGGFLALALVLAVILLLREKVFNKRDLRYFLLLSLPIITAGLFYSFSRAAWLAAGVGLACLAVRALAARQSLQIWKVLVSTALVLLMAVVLVNAAVELVLTRVEASAFIEKQSLDTRTRQLSQSGRLISQNFWFGLGAGNYLPGLMAEYPGQERHEYQPVHNTFLLIWAETGIFGLLGFFALIYYLFINIYKEYPGALLIVLVVLTLFDHWFWSLYFGALFFWLILGIVNRNIRVDRGNKLVG